MSTCQDVQISCLRLFIAHMPSARSGHTTVAVGNNKLLLFGGKTINIRSKDVYLNDMYYLHSDCSQIAWMPVEYSGCPPCPRYCHSTVYHQDNMFTFGGWHTSPSDDTQDQGNVKQIFCQDFFVFHVLTNVWSCVETVGNRPRPRCQAPAWHLASSSNPLSRGYMVIFGGACHTEVNNAFSTFSLCIKM